MILITCPECGTDRIFVMDFIRSRGIHRYHCFGCKEEWEENKILNKMLEDLKPDWMLEDLKIVRDS